MLSIFLSEKLEHLVRQSHDTIFLEYYCDNKDNRRNSAIAILRGLLYQLLKSRPNLAKHIIPEFQIQREKLFAESSSQSSFPSLWRIFRAMLQDPDLDTVYCVLDGLDECEGDSLKMLLSNLKTLFLTESGPKTLCHLKMIVTSRDFPGSLSEVLSSLSCITLDLDADAEINRDIDLFIEDKINELCKLRRFSDQLCAHIKDVFRKRAQGTFLWIGIAAQELGEYLATEVEKALKSFPSGLEPLFARMLLQIKSERRQTIAQILRWVVMAARPLTVLELSIAIKQPNHDHGHGRTVPFSREEIMRDQILSCGFLLSITKDTVNLVHQSVKDYLLRKISDSNPELEAFRIKENEGNLELARRCFYYLQDVALTNEQPVEDPQTFRMSSERRQGLPKEFPLLSYSMQYWAMHASALSHKDDIFDLSNRFYKDPKFCALWRKMYLDFDDTRGHRIPFNLLHMASYFDLKVLAENIISTFGSVKSKKSSGAKSQLNEPDTRGTTALHLSAKRGYVAMSQLLLDNEALIDTRDNFRRTALHVTVGGGHVAVVRLLLDRGASTEAKNSFKKTPLHCAAEGGHSAVVGLLLDRGASTKAKNSFEETPLHSAAEGGHSAVVGLLLDRRASTEAKNSFEETPLHCAAEGGHSAVVGLLLDRRASTEAKNSFEKTPLHCAASGRHKATMELLLDRGAFVDAEDKHGMRPLHIAASLGSLVMVQLLLRHKANITAKDKDESTPLHFAAQSGNAELVQLLLNRYAFVRAKNKFSMTPLHYAAEKGQSAVVQVLLRHKANINSRDSHGWTALHYAAQYKKKETLQLLLENGADLEMKCKKGKTALHKAAKLGCLSIVQVLLDEGAFINAQDKSGYTAVHHAAKEGYTVTFRDLLIRGASTEIRNRKGLTALQVAEQSPYRKRVAVVRLTKKFRNNRRAIKQDTEDDSVSDEVISSASDAATHSASHKSDDSTFDVPLVLETDDCLFDSSSSLESDDSV